jgi:hypothetical protein
MPFLGLLKLMSVEFIIRRKKIQEIRKVKTETADEELREGRFCDGID